MGEAETIAKGLTKAQREAVLAAVEVKHGPYPARFEVRHRVWRALTDKKLAFAGRSILGFGRGTTDRGILTPLGLEVRRHLLEGADNAER